MKSPAAVLAAAHRNLPEGELILGASVHLLSSQGAPLLRVDADLFLAGDAQAGYVRRSWGRNGLIVDSTASLLPFRIAPLSLHVLPGVNRLDWIARVASIPSVEPQGGLRLAADQRADAGQEPLRESRPASVLEAFAGAAHDVEGVPLLGHGMLLRGEAVLLARAPGMATLCLLAEPRTRGVRVQWFAIGQRHEDGEAR